MESEHAGSSGRVVPTPVANPDVFSPQASPSNHHNAGTSADAISVRTAPDDNTGVSSLEFMPSDGFADDEHKTWDRAVDAKLEPFGLRKGTPLTDRALLFLVLRAVVDVGATKPLTEVEIFDLLNRPDVAALLSESWTEDKGYRAVRQHGDSRNKLSELSNAHPTCCSYRGITYRCPIRHGGNEHTGTGIRFASIS